jgi:hypothetical protein
MFYKALGFVVWQGGSRFVRYRYKRQLQFAGGGAAVAGILVGALVALLLAKRDSE